MQFNLLFLSLLGGFIFVRNWKRTRYYALRADGHVLLFYSAIAGGFWLFIASVLIFHFTPEWPLVNELWHLIVPFEYSGRAALACLLGATAWVPLNVFYRDSFESYRIIKQRKNPFELLFRTTLGTKQLIAISLKNRKVYVGYVMDVSNPAFALESVAIVPIISGFRDSKDQTVIFTTRYTDAYERIHKSVGTRVRQEISNDPTFKGVVEDKVKDEQDKAINVFKHTIMVREIDTAFAFKMDIYNQYFGPKVTESPSLSPIVSK